MFILTSIACPKCERTVYIEDSPDGTQSAFICDCGYFELVEMYETDYPDLSDME